MRGKAILALVLLCLAASAAGQVVERPDIRAGSEWRFAVYYSVPTSVPNRTWVVTAVAPDGIEGTENGEPLRLTRDLGVLDSPQNSSSNPRYLEFPLAVGRNWRFVNDWVFKPKGSRGRFSASVTVLAWEKVRVPAGEFDAFKLSVTEKISGTSPIGSQYAGETTRTYWYAPAARAVVKWISHNPYLGSSTTELVSFRLAD